MGENIKLVEFIDEKGVTIHELASRMGLSPRTIKRYLKELEEKGLVESRDGLYLLTPVGVKFKKALEVVKSRKEASPYIVTDPFSGNIVPLSFKNYRQLLAIIENELVDKKILDEHVRKYLIEWVKTSIGDEYLVYLLENNIVKNVDDLKEYLSMILKTIED
mgnify:FL=1